MKAKEYSVSYTDIGYDKITVTIVVFAHDEYEAWRMARDMLYYNGYATPRLRGDKVELVKKGG